MSRLFLKFTLFLIINLVFISCENSSTPISPVDSRSESPTEVVNLTATIVDESKILLTWEDEARNERGFEIFERSGSEGEFIPLMRTEANVTSVLLDKHRRKFDFYYKVRAINGNGSSEFSNQAHVVGFQKAVTIDGVGSFNKIAFSPDGNQIAGVGSWATDYGPDAEYGNLVIADATSGELIHLRESPNINYQWRNTCLAYSPDGNILIVGRDRGEIELWNAINGEYMQSEMIMPFEDYRHFWGSGVSDLAYSNNGRFIAVGGNDEDTSSVAILRANSLKLYYQKFNFSGLIADIEFSHDSYILAVLVYDGNSGGLLSLHRSEDGHGEGNFEFENHGSPSIAFHPDGKLLALSTGQEVIMLDYRSLEVEKRVPIKGSDISFSIDGNHLASIYSTISFWNCETGISEFTLDPSERFKNYIPRGILGYKINPFNSSIAILHNSGGLNDGIGGYAPVDPIEIWY